MPAAAQVPGRSRSCPSRQARGPRWRRRRSSPWRLEGAPSFRSRRAPRRRRRPGTTTASSSCAAGARRGASRTRSSSRARRCRTSTPIKLRRFQNGTTAGGASRVDSYRWPAAPFGYPPNITDPPVVEDGAERVYLVPHLDRPVVNLGVSVVSAESGAVIDPWLLGSLDENDVQGEAGTPVDVNPLTFDFGLPIGAAATVFPRLQRFYVSVDSAQDVYTGKPLRGRYRLRYWVNDLRPPKIRLLTQPRRGRTPNACRASPGHRRGSRSLLVADRLQDGRPGCDCLRLELRRGHLSLPTSAPQLRRGARARSSAHRTSRRRRTSRASAPM